MTRFDRRRAPRGARLVGSVATLAAVAAAVAGIGATQGSAAPYGHAAAAGGHVRAKLKHDVLEIRGSRESDSIVLRLAAGDPGTLQLDVGDDGSADFAFARAELKAIEVDARRGNDVVRIDDSGGTFTDAIATTIGGGADDDTLLGGDGAERFLGGDGADRIDGNRGVDTGVMGEGNDVFVWDPGDGSDIVEGDAGEDTMVFNGASGPEQFELSANGHRLKFFRTQGNITMDTFGVEQVFVPTLGGADLVTVNDLSATDVRGVGVDLAGALGGSTGDGGADRVVVNGTNGDDAITVSGDAGGVMVSGLASTVAVLHAEGASDSLEVNTLAGRDAVSAAHLAAGVIQLFVDGIAAR
jgi:Ca2+-binding RTX toxin-like protein